MAGDAATRHGPDVGRNVLEGEGLPRREQLHRCVEQPDVVDELLGLTLPGHDGKHRPHRRRRHSGEEEGAQRRGHGDPAGDGG